MAWKGVWKHSFIKNDFHLHSAKSLRIRSYFGPHFPAFGLNAGKYGPE